MKTIWNNIQRRDLIIFLCILSVVTFSPLPTANAEQAPVSIIIDTVKQNYIQQPFIVDGTTMVPMSAIFRTLGAAVIWDSSTKTVTATKGSTVIKVKIGSTLVSVNNTAIQLRVAPSIVLGYTFVPLKFVSEALGASVAWDGTSRTVTIMTVKNSGFTEILAQNSNQEFSFQNIAMGDSESKVIEQLGAPGRKDLSEYGFTWYVYNQDYAKYVQVGILSGKVVALYTNSNTWVSKEGIRIGSAKADVTNAYGSNPLVSILKENTLFSLDAGTGVGKEHGTYLLDGSYATIFYDNHKNDTVTAVQIIDKKVEESLLGYFGVPSEQLRISFERQNFDITNSLRVRFGLKPFIWNDAIANTARKHSQDMMNRNYFAHLNLDGDSPFDRMTADGIKYSKAAENIFAGARSAIYAHEGWMNSEGHRHNILSDIQRLGVGVAFGGSYKVYVTQNFYTPL